MLLLRLLLFGLLLSLGTVFLLLHSALLQKVYGQRILQSRALL
jgi:hypothetical protein